jgi:hypothetical protein
MQRLRFLRGRDRRPDPSKLRCKPLQVYTVTCALGVLGSAQAEIVVDGVLDESEWRDAAVCSDWGRTEPYARDAPRYHNEVRIASTQTGLIAAFTVAQPAGELRVKPRAPRDAALIGDSVTLVVDFDANGQIGYQFSVGLSGSVSDGLVLNQNELDKDWDGVWQHAVRETPDQWVVEMHLPWSCVSRGYTGGEQRTWGV